MLEGSWKKLRHTSKVHMYMLQHAHFANSSSAHICCYIIGGHRQSPAVELTALTMPRERPHANPEALVTELTQKVNTQKAEMEKAIVSSVLGQLRDKVKELENDRWMYELPRYTYN